MKLTMNKEGKTMQLTKKKVFSAALAVCLIAICSMGTLAWFSAEDAVTNEFMVAGSETGDPDDIFSVDVSEKSDDPDAKETEDGIQYDKILPGDKLSKIVDVTNTGSCNQFIRVKIEVSNAKLWQTIYQADMVPVTEFVDFDVTRTDLYGVGSYLDGENFVYYLYFTEELEPKESMGVFKNAFVAEGLTKEQASEIGGKFTIEVSADAVQTENVGDNVYEAFKTVGMEIPVNTTFVENDVELNSALAEDGYIVLTEDIEFVPGLKVEKAVNLYLNNHTLYTVNNESPYVHSMNVLGDLTIGGYGKVVLPDLYGIRLDGTLNIFGGTFVDNENREYNKQEALINVYANGKLYIYAGTFEGQDYCVYVREAGATVNLGNGDYVSQNMVDANKLN